MKKLLCATALALISIVASAQTSQGTLVISGAVDIKKNANSTETMFGAPSSHESSGFNIGLGPAIGIMLNKNYELGAAISYYYSKRKAEQTDSENNYSHAKYKTHGLAFTPYLKKYFMLSDKFALTGDFSVGYTTSNTKTIVEEQHRERNFKDNELFTSLSPGITFFPTDKIGLSAGFGGLNYSRSTSQVQNESSTKSTLSIFSFDIQNAASFGFKYYITR